MPETRQWTALLPLKDSPRSKSRLAAERGFSPDQSRQFATAMASDVVDACRVSHRVGQVAIVAPAPTLFRPECSLIRLTETPGAADLNAVLRGAIRDLRAASSHVQIIIILADLACVRSDSIDRMCAAAPIGASGFVRDHANTGTTMMLIPTGDNPHLAFGPNSATHHAAAGSNDLTEFAGPDARLDLDTDTDLVNGVQLGFGKATGDFLAKHVWGATANR